MGFSVLASCPCGYRSPELMIGGGMASFRHLCAFPAYCSSGGHLVIINMFDEPLRCPCGDIKTPVPYDDESLVGVIGERVVAEWRLGPQIFQLTDGSYLCPECRELSLTFSVGDIMWD